jgi:hypothetical protein
MTASQFRKSARHARWLSIGHSRVRPDIHLSPQIARQFVAFDAARRSFIRRLAVAQLVGSAQPRSVCSPAAIKSP